ncbi:MAG: CARDB domain-containing protein [Coprococcus sp.]
MKLKTGRLKIKSLRTIMMAVMLVIGVLGGINGSIKKINAAYATPRLMVTGADIPNDKVKAGETFDLVLHLKNESTTTRLMNISIKLSSEDNQIITASGSDSIYIDSIDINTDYDVTVSLKTRGDLEQKAYSLNVAYTYEDRYNDTYSDTAAVSIPIVQEPKLSISEKRVSRSQIVVDGKTSFSFNINNLGKDKIYNVSAEFIGDTIEDISTYIGSIEVGNSKSVDMSITGKKAGDGKVKVKISYEDAEGNVSSITEDFDLVVSEAVLDVMEVEKETISPVLFIVAGICILIIIIIIISVVRKKREKRYE